MSQSESRRRTEVVGVRLAADELAVATFIARRRGMNVPELIRSLLHVASLDYAGTDGFPAATRAEGTAAE